VFINFEHTGKMNRSQIPRAENAITIDNLTRGIMAAAHGVVRYPGSIALGINSKTLSKIINGKSGISLEMAFRLSIAF
jgi:hypothetical protein